MSRPPAREVDARGGAGWLRARTLRGVRGGAGDRSATPALARSVVVPPKSGKDRAARCEAR